MLFWLPLIVIVPTAIAAAVVILRRLAFVCPHRLAGRAVVVRVVVLFAVRAAKARSGDGLHRSVLG